MLNKLIISVFLLVSVGAFADGEYKWFERRLEAIQKTNFTDIRDMSHTLGKLFLQIEEKYPSKSHEFYKHGAYQELLMTIFTKAFNGRPFDEDGFVGWDHTTSADGDDSLTFLRRLIYGTTKDEGMQLDVDGLKKLKAYVLAFEGLTPEYAEFQEQILEDLEKVRPVDFIYTDYEYNSIKEPTQTVFEYKSFNYDETKKEPVTAKELQNDWIKNFAREMQKHLKGSNDQIERVHELLKEQAINPDRIINITLLGTSGNGKTEFAKSLARVKYGSKDDMFKMTFTGNKGELNNYFNSSKGYVGSDSPTEFELWVKERIEKGQGGVIVLDELLSFHGLTKEQIAEKAQMINQLYDLLDERVVQIGGEAIDLKNFDVVITGNAFQDLFNGLDDNPDVEKNVARIISKVTRQDMVKYLGDYGFDPPKIARLGEIFINGPLPRAQVQEVGELLLQKNLAHLAGMNDIKVDVDKDVIAGIVKRLTTIELGMREVNLGISQLVTSPVNGILFDMKGEDVKSIDAKIEGDTIRWFVNGEEVVQASEVINESSGLRQKEWKLKSKLADNNEVVTPQFKDLNTPKKPVVEDIEKLVTTIHEVKGHWMVDTLLKGENQASAVNIIPSGNSLGYVMPKLDDDTIKLSSLTTIYKRILMLEAGHRAPIIEGIYATGGGSANRDPGTPPSDDLGKIDKNLDAIMNNHLFKDYHEHSDEKTVKVFREVLRELGKEATDAVIVYGNQTEFADELVRELLEGRGYVQEGFLDDYAAKAFAKLESDPDLIFLKALNTGLNNMSERYSKLDPKDLAIRTKMLQDITSSIHTEIQAIRKYSKVGEGVLNMFQDERKKTSKILASYGKSSTCLGILGRLLRGRR